MGGEGLRMSERGVFAEELQLSCAMSGLKLRQDQPSEQAREHAYGEEEAGPAGDPALTIERDAAARHDHVDVRMVAPTPTIP
jgi:hypothetical protein